jgi:hypothetical protein
MDQHDTAVLDDQHDGLNTLKQVVHRYFESLYHDDVRTLRLIFDDHAHASARTATEPGAVAGGGQESLHPRGTGRSFRLLVAGDRASRSAGPR